MSRSMWKGLISFGLVTIPVQLFSAIERNEIRFHLLDKGGKCRLREKLYCPETGEEFNFQDTARGYEIAPDNYILINEDELARLKPEAGRSIDIHEFVSLKEIDPIYFNRAYYLAPDERGAKAYALLAQAMLQAGRVGIAKFVMRNSEYLAALRATKDGLIILETMYYAEDIRSTEELPLPKDVKAGKKELDLAIQLISNLEAHFDAGKFQNEYRDRVQHLLDEKAKGHEVKIPKGSKRPASNVVNLVEMLKRSVTKGRTVKKKGATSSAEKSEGKRRKLKKAA